MTSVLTAEITDTLVPLMWNGGNNMELEVRHKQLGVGVVVIAGISVPTYTITWPEPKCVGEGVL